MSIDQIIGHMGKVLVVDDEVSNLASIKNYLKQQNQFDVETFTDGEEAWARLKTQKYNFVIMGWRLKGITGIAFLNRIRRFSGTSMLPVIVSSGMINRNDFRILGEFPNTKLLEAPFSRIQFERTIEGVLKEKLWYQANSEMVRSIIETSRGKRGAAESQIQKMLKSAPNPVPLALLAVRSLISNGQDDAAKEILDDILAKNPNNAVALNELAKIHCRKRNYSRAYDALSLAKDLSPQNMQRICLLGEVSLSLRDPFGAKKYFNEALEIDKHDIVAEAGVTLSKNMLDFPSHSDGVALTASFASLLNTIGIAFVHMGKFEKGVEQYLSAMMFVRESIDIAKIMFNLGLCYMRWGKRAKALPWFEKSSRFAGGKFFKSDNYILSLKNQLNLGGDKQENFASVWPTDVSISYSATDAALKKALTPEPASTGRKIITFDDDNLEERVGNIVGDMLSQDAIKEVLSTSVDEIEKMDIEMLDEIA
jgi:two-component system chemotaxis response regulator CheY